MRRLLAAAVGACLQMRHFRTMSHPIGAPSGSVRRGIRPCRQPSMRPRRGIPLPPLRRRITTYLDPPGARRLNRGRDPQRCAPDDPLPHHLPAQQCMRGRPLGAAPSRARRPQNARHAPGMRRPSVPHPLDHSPDHEQVEGSCRACRLSLSQPWAKGHARGTPCRRRVNCPAGALGSEMGEVRLGGCCSMPPGSARVPSRTLRPVRQLSRSRPWRGFS